MALTLLAANNAQTVLAAGISSSATSLTVNTGTGALFPSPSAGVSFFKLTLIDAATGQLTEILHVTARSGDTMTVLRAQEGTTARAWSANDIAANMLTSGTLSFFAQNESPAFTGTPTAPTPTTGDSTTKLATTAFVAASIAANPGRLINIQVFTSSGTYTPTAGTKKIKVRAQGAGGGGGGAQACPSSGQIAAGHGASAGTYGETGLIDVTSVSSVVVTVGNAGVGVLGDNGTSGGNSSFGAYITAPGGTFGNFGAAGTANFSIVPDIASSGVCTGTNVLFSIPGEGGRGQFSFNSTAVANHVKGGIGGSSFMGKAGAALSTNTNPESSKGYGAGGTGASVTWISGGAPALAGASGSSGIVIVEEYA